MESDTVTAESTTLDLVDGILQKQRHALARAITLLEKKDPLGQKLLGALAPKLGNAKRVGITGPPGSGKSTLVGELLRLLDDKNCSVGVIAVDPSSPFTGGAVLGDRIRMGSVASKDNMFIRSMAARGVFGGLAEASRGAADLMDAYGFDYVILETVGVGQTEVEVARAADVVAVVLSPESGDGMQAMKAGVMEIGNLYVVNKADRNGADTMQLTLEAEMSLRPGKNIPVLKTSATSRKGISELLDVIEEQFRKNQTSQLIPLNSH